MFYFSLCPFSTLLPSIEGSESILYGVLLGSLILRLSVGKWEPLKGRGSGRRWEAVRKELVITLLVPFLPVYELAVLPPFS